MIIVFLLMMLPDVRGSPNGPVYNNSNILVKTYCVITVILTKFVKELRVIQFWISKILQEYFRKSIFE